MIFIIIYYVTFLSAYIFIFLLQVQEEFKINVDPYFINRDGNMYGYTIDLNDCQNDLKDYLESVLASKEPMELDHLVNVQWLIMKQQHSIAMLFDIATKYQQVCIYHN